MEYGVEIMNDSDLRKRRALVTGASSGLGVDFARELASRGADLILVARREDRLLNLASQLKETHGIEVDVRAKDLGTPSAPLELFDDLTAAKLDVDILINNAGFGIHGSFVDTPWDRELQMLQLDVLTLVHLTKLFVKGMVERGYGRILQIASIGAYQPLPTYAAYGAAKSFVLNHGVAINDELRNTGVSCTVLSPGVTATEFFDVAGQSATFYHRMVMMESHVVARIGIEAMLRQRASIVPGFINTVSTMLVGLFPRSWSARIAGLLMQDSD